MRVLAASLAALMQVAALSVVGEVQPAHAEPACGPKPAVWAPTMTDVAIPMRDGRAPAGEPLPPRHTEPLSGGLRHDAVPQGRPHVTKPSIVDNGYLYALVECAASATRVGRTTTCSHRTNNEIGADLAHWFAAPERLWNQGVHQKVGMMGQSYLGITQWFTAEQPGVDADLGAIFPCKAYSDIYRDIVYHGGILDSLFAMEWGFGTGLWWTLPPAPWTEAGTSPDVYKAWLLHLQNEPVIAKALEHPYDDRRCSPSGRCTRGGSDQRSRVLTAVAGTTASCAARSTRGVWSARAPTAATGW